MINSICSEQEGTKNISQSNIENEKKYNKSRINIIIVMIAILHAFK